MKAMLEAPARRQGFGSARIERNVRLLTDLLRRGRGALDAILPAECVQPARQKRRRFDAALLFLVYPIGVVGQAMADQIVGDVVGHLQGDVGIRRYIGDRIGAPTTASCFRRKSEAATSVRTWSAATAC